MTLSSASSAVPMAVTPQPTDEETAAIVAAIEMAWPRPVASLATPARRLTWKFSGRWWAVPLPARRARPWR